MGGVFAPVGFSTNELPVGIDHNLNVEQAASVRALNAGMTTLYVGCDVTMGAWMTATQLDALARATRSAARWLARSIVHAGLAIDGRGAIPEKYVALLHDPLAVSCTVDRRFVTSMRRAGDGRDAPRARAHVHRSG